MVPDPGLQWPNIPIPRFGCAELTLHLRTNILPAGHWNARPLGVAALDHVKYSVLELEKLVERETASAQ